jgi:hypothetical protein
MAWGQSITVPGINQLEDILDNRLGDDFASLIGDLAT